MPPTLSRALLGHDDPEAEAEATVLANITRYCCVSWRKAFIAPDFYQDATQMVIETLLERLPDRRNWARIFSHRDGDEHRELVRAIDKVTKRFRRTKTHVQLNTDVPHAADERAHDARALWEHILSLMQRFSEFQQRILVMTRDGWCVPEIALELQTTPERVSDAKYKAIRKLRALVC